MRNVDIYLTKTKTSQNDTHFRLSVPIHTVSTECPEFNATFELSGSEQPLEYCITGTASIAIIFVSLRWYTATCLKCVKCTAITTKWLLIPSDEHNHKYCWGTGELLTI